MQLIIDTVLLSSALGAALYCFVLANRLRRFNDLENGVGGAIAVLSAQVDDMTKALEGARKTAAHSASSLDGMTERAESASRRLELLVAALHDLPDPEDLERLVKRAEAGKPEQTLFQSQRGRVAGATQ